MAEQPTWEDTVGELPPSWHSTEPEIPSWSDTVDDAVATQAPPLQFAQELGSRDLSPPRLGFEVPARTSEELGARNFAGGGGGGIPTTAGDVARGAMSLASYPGRLAYAAAADLLASNEDKRRETQLRLADLGNDVDIQPKADYGGNLARLPEDPMLLGKLPASQSIDEAAKYAPKTAVAANLAKAAPELVAMAAVNPTGALGRLGALGFSADMVIGAKPLFEQYAEESNKPADEQDPAKLAELRAAVIQTFAFAPLAGAHGAVGEAKPVIDPNVVAREALNIQPRRRTPTENPPQPPPGVDLQRYQNDPKYRAQVSGVELPTGGQDAVSIKTAGEVGVRDPSAIREEVGGDDRPAITPQTPVQGGEVAPAENGEVKTAEKWTKTEPRKKHVYRGMEPDEFNSTVAAGKGILSKNSGTEQDGTSFVTSSNAGLASDYALYGDGELTSPRPLGYVVEARRSGIHDSTAASDAGEAVSGVETPFSDVTRIWEVREINGQKVYKEIPINETKTKPELQTGEIRNGVVLHGNEEAKPEIRSIDEKVRSTPDAIRNLSPSEFYDWSQGRDLNAEQAKLAASLPVEEIQKAVDASKAETEKRKAAAKDANSINAFADAANQNQFWNETLAKSKSQPTKKNAESRSESQPNLKEQLLATSMVGAVHGELSLGSGADIYGVAERVRKEREAAGQTAPTEPGEGISAPDSVAKGREILAANPNAGEQALKVFESSPDKPISASGVAAARARGEELALIARNTESQYGTDSNEFRQAHQELSDWDKRIKPMQTEWHKIGQAQQGETDIDTGTFTGLSRAYTEATGQEFNPTQKVKAEKIAKDVSKADKAVEPEKQKLNIEIEKIGEPKVPPHVRLIAEKLKDYFDNRATNALARIKARRAEGRLLTGIPVEELADYADYGASKILNKGIEGAEMAADWAKEMTAEIGEFVTPHLKQIWDASRKVLDEQLAKVAGKEKEAVKKVVRKVATERVSNAEQAAREAANKTVRDAAADAAKAETAARVAAAKLATEASKIRTKRDAAGKSTETVRDAASKAPKSETNARVEKAKQAKNLADIEAERTRKALESAQERVRQMAKGAVESENKRRIEEAQAKSEAWRNSLEAKQLEFRKYVPNTPMSDVQLKVLWNHIKTEYIDKDNESMADIVNKVATDLGLSTKDVLRGMSQNSGIKRIADNVWQKQKFARQLKNSAKRWLETANDTWLSKVLPGYAKAMFKLKTSLHGTVALGTHAPLVAATHPKIFAENFGKMYKLVASPEYYEMQAHDLARRPNYQVANRAGLVNDMSKMEDFNDPALQKAFPKLAEFFRKNLDKIGVGKLQGMGVRGYSVLKIIRQDLFDNEWNKLAESEKSPEMAKAIADSVNHMTGVVNANIHPAANVAFFAPKLLLSRLAVMGGDPYRAANSLLKLQNMTPEERWFAKNQFKEKAKIFAVWSSLMVSNQAFNNYLGDKKKLNGVPKALGGAGYDPLKSDFMKFHVAGHNFAWGSPFLTSMRLPLRIIRVGMGDGGKTKYLIYPDEDVYKILGSYGRTQLSPAASPVVSLLFKGDYENRPLPQIPGYGPPPPVPKRLAAQGVKPYTWKEFGAETILNIPFEEAAKEAWHAAGNHGSEKEWESALMSIIVNAGTGGRLTEDWEQKQKK